PILSLLSSSRDLRYLPPFPTRRSSDLIAPLLTCGAALPPDRCKTPRSTRLQDASELGLYSRVAHHPWRDRNVALAILTQSSSGRDRKSTRLNSSHVKISYAVFCLKKKN